MVDLSPFCLYITGVTGTGKTSVAKKLSKQLSLDYLEINTLVLEKGFYLGYDINRDSVIIDDELLISHIESIITDKKRLCLVGGIIPLKNVIDLIIVLRCGVNILKQRLTSRNYPKDKIESNLEAEIMNIVYYEAVEFFPGQEIVEIYNDNITIDETCNQIVSIVRQHHPSILE
ncbi:MAG: adenylate kinase family protein [Candidatus Heimdallarchaeota archaeon]|nr:MAG: adenylate kinase family protein [Candidatus Heimdallarchaeota archaeon]